MSVPIGVRGDELFTLSSRIRMRPGDILLLVSDGVFEARSPDGAYFGLDRVLETVANHRDKDASTIVQRLHDAAIEFAGRRSLDDDLTAVVVKVTGQSEALRETWTSRETWQV
jgi:sigma-B regulation protein RsbU (phosphoserine phosphatase)